MTITVITNRTELNAYGQPPRASTSGAVAGPAATVYFIKFKVMPGKNAEFEKAISEMMVGVREEAGNVSRAASRRRS